jgi:hypothetical protein
MMGRLKNVSQKVDVVLAIIMALSLVILFMNGNHISPRERRYEEKVNQVNALIYTRVMQSQEFFVGRRPDEIPMGTERDNLPWQVAETPKQAYDYVMTSDPVAKQQIGVYVADFHKWEVTNKYTQQEIKESKAKLNVLTDEQQAQYQFKLNQLREQYKTAVDKRFTELEKIAKANEASLAASQRAVAVAESISIQASIAAKLSVSSSIASSTATQTSVSSATEVSQVTPNTSNSSTQQADDNQNSGLSSGELKSSESSSSSVMSSSESDVVNDSSMTN